MRREKEREIGERWGNKKRNNSREKRHNSV